MLKDKVVASLGQKSLLMPTWIKAALAANDRLKLYLSILQSAEQHAHSPSAPNMDWSRELAKLGLHEEKWLQGVVKSAYFDDDSLVFPEQPQLLLALSEDISVMARPMCEESSEQTNSLLERREYWLNQIEQNAESEGISSAFLRSLTHGDRKAGDSFHLFVMDLHKELNSLSSEIATETIDGAHVWQIDSADQTYIKAFMRGLHRTAPLKFSHPGLDTAVTRDGDRLLIQNDIGTNDVHVLVIEVLPESIQLTYSDLHKGRFNFFKQLLEDIGFSWHVFEPKTSDGLNAGKPYHLGNATLNGDREVLLAGLEALAAQIVFVIDWNRARKRLEKFIAKSQVQELLRHAAKEQFGHMGWLMAGGEQLIYKAMQDVDNEAFRVGDRLDDVLGESAASNYLAELLRMASVMLQQKQPQALIADEARILLARILRNRTFEFDLLAEHAAYCHALAFSLCDTFDAGARIPLEQMQQQVNRAKKWERQADHQLMEARVRAERQERWGPVLGILDKADDIADALEEAMFTYSLSLVPPLTGLPAPVLDYARQLANTTLAAIQDQIKAIEIARHLSDNANDLDSDQFLQTIWRMLRAERICDDLSRQARVEIIRHLHSSAASLMIANELVNALEKASDHLLAAGYALRQLVLTKTGVK
nr:DUF47 family protein [uncultured Undibacterium sp.]